MKRVGYLLFIVIVCLSLASPALAQQQADWKEAARLADRGVRAAESNEHNTRLLIRAISSI